MQLISLVLLYLKRTTFTKVIIVISLTISILYEFLQMWAKRGEYFLEPINYLDLPGYVSGLIWAIYY